MTAKRTTKRRPTKGIRQRPDGTRTFEPGNQVAAATATHGARSPAQIAERALALRSRLFEIAPWTAEEHYGFTVDLYLKALAAVSKIDEHLETIGMEKASTRWFEQRTAASNHALKLSHELGLTPQGHAKLKLTATGAQLNLAALAAAGKAAAEENPSHD
ncbi:MAG TPA: hypothetical protein VGH09_12510 [Solirubrobacteraceae bacterium]|jgi:hypothetical protein